ncbi:MAG: hypothetical protein UT36_C0001G0190 [Candidatus Peregrinibacteria bacterium GW2011_GWF2_39_17]|nr:MAG: hypothetical protein UT36_C0001G0190 [Candidatus Peregrinibacteria bacterium GW2011_GWF2_39_17]HCW32628.1 hypothetical protein [Candidatus Peregrinibacteria bacterium]
MKSVSKLGILAAAVLGANVALAGQPEQMEQAPSSEVDHSQYTFKQRLRLFLGMNPGLNSETREDLAGRAARAALSDEQKKELDEIVKKHKQNIEPAVSATATTQSSAQVDSSRD